MNDNTARLMAGVEPTHLITWNFPLVDGMPPEFGRSEQIILDFTDANAWDVWNWLNGEIEIAKAHVAALEEVAS